MSSSLTSLASATTAAPVAAPQLWDEIVRWTLEACVHHKQGHDREVAVLLQETLPALIRSWSDSAGLPTETCKQRLRDLFRRAQESVEFGSIHRRLIVDEILARLKTETAVPAVRPVDGGQMRLRRRVPIDDIPGMLDAIAESEVEIRSEALLPMRTAGLALINLFSGGLTSPVPQTA